MKNDDIRMLYELDEIDLPIVAVLQADASIENQESARRVHLYSRAEGRCERSAPATPAQNLRLTQTARQQTCATVTRGLCGPLRNIRCCGPLKQF